MKKVLSLLTIFVFLNVTSWAYPPDYGSNGDVQNLTGTYAGVIIPVSVVGGTNGGSSLGVFAIGIPGTTSGQVIANGVGVLFADGAGYNLNINGVFNPQNSVLSAIIFGQSNFEIIVINELTGDETIYTIEAEGAMNGTITAPTSNSAASGPGTKNSARISGTATIDTFSRVNANGPIITGTIFCTVFGFQQSGTYSIPTLTPVTFPGGGS